MPVPVQLPPLDEIRRNWAACAAVMEATGYGRYCCAWKSLWHWDDAGGSWVQLQTLAGERAVVYGWDRDFSDTYFRESAKYFDKEETDLLDGVPDWWGHAIEHQRGGPWLGFVYGYEHGQWARACYDVYDGFPSLNLPFVSEARTLQYLTDRLAPSRHTREVFYVPEKSDVIDLLDAAPLISHELLAAAFGPTPADIDEGVAAAHRFAHIGE